MPANYCDDCQNVVLSQILHLTELISPSQTPLSVSLHLLLSFHPSQSYQPREWRHKAMKVCSHRFLAWERSISLSMMQRETYLRSRLVFVGPEDSSSQASDLTAPYSLPSEKKSVSRETMRGLGLLIREQTKNLQRLNLSGMKCLDEEDLVELVESSTYSKALYSLHLQWVRVDFHTFLNEIKVDKIKQKFLL